MPAASLLNAKQLSCRRRRQGFARTALFIAFIGASLGITRNTRGEDAPKITMAGTFNNWATSDDVYRLKPRNDHYELWKYWDCGRHKFKFVFDGAWTRHLGAAPDGALQQPGDDIILNIPNSGEYLISLDLSGKSWSIEHKPPKKPHAIVSILRRDQKTYLLDPSLSLACDGHPIRYHWFIRSENLEPTDWTLVREGRADCLTMKRPGTLDIILMIADDEKKNHVAFRGEFGTGFQLKTRVQKNTFGIPMQQIAEDKWAAEYVSDFDGVERFISDGLEPMDVTNPAQLTVEKGRHYLMVYDRTKKLVSHDPTTSYAVLRYEPKSDDRLPKDLFIEHIAAAGTFNNWDPTETPLRKNPDGAYEALIFPAEGVHHYKIVVNGCIYLEDTLADPRLAEPDGAGGRNSGVRIGDNAEDFGPAKPDKIAAAALRHDPGKSEYFSAYSDTDALITLRTLADDVQGVRLVLTGSRDPIEMFKSDSRVGFDYWQTAITTTDRQLDYTFELRDGAAVATFDQLGFHTEKPETIAPFKQSMNMAFQTPDWAKKAVWYQIFPERFRNGTPDNDPPRTVPWTQQWDKPYKPGKGVKKGSPADFVEKGTFWDYIFDRRYGGDLQGVREKLPYLRELGVTAIYFNPIFLAESMHKYDASDYRHIDDFFGVKDSLKKIEGETTDPATWQWSDSDKVFLDFIQEAHRMGFKVIIDGVFNHVGRNFWAFQDVLKNGQNSEYAGWFDIVSFDPFHYRAWDADDGSLPRLKHDVQRGLAKPVRDHLFAVTRRWMDPNGDGDPSDGIDGWRLDVAGDINANFWRDWRQVVKSTNKDAYIVAELWEESRPWLDGKTFDAVMNYPFAVRCQRFFVNQAKATKPGEFDRELKEMLAWYLPQVNYVLQNLFCSHDTDRVASMFMNPDLEYDKTNRLQDNGPNYNTAKPTPECYHKLKSMVAFQMSFLGAPMIYYGDEVGMYGADDPSDRKPMHWADLPPNDDPNERIVPDVLECHRRAIAIRNTYPALQLGAIRTLETRDDMGIYAFCRTLGGQTVVVVVNNSDKQHRLDIPSPWKDGADIVRLDDPEQAELVMPPDDKPTARPTVKPRTGRHSNLKVENSRLHGLMLAPRTTALFTRVME